MRYSNVDSLDDPRINLFLNLTDHQLRQSKEAQEGIFIAESPNVVRTAILEGLVPKALLLDQKKAHLIEDVLPLVPDDVPIFMISGDEAQKICGYRVVRGILGAFERPQLPCVSELLKKGKRLCVLEGLTDTSNVGAIFRNCAALGADGVIIAPTCADPLCRRAVRTSMGSVLKIPFAYAPKPWPYKTFEQLKEFGFSTYALALSDDAIQLDLVHPKPEEKIAMVFGSEGYGLQNNTLGLCDTKLIIPMAHEVDSLNVAAASAIALWQLCS